MKGIRYAPFWGAGNSAATSALLGAELKNSPEFAVAATPDLLLADLAMIVRNGVLVAIFSLAVGPQASLAVLVVLGPMALVAAFIAVFMLLRSRGKSATPFAKIAAQVAVGAQFSVKLCLPLPYAHRD